MPLGRTWRQGKSGRVLEDRDPYTDEVLARIAMADEGDLDEAFRDAAASQPSWHGMLPGEKSAVVRRAGEIIDARREEIVDWLVRESGSTRIKANVEWEYARNVTFEAASFSTRAANPSLWISRLTMNK